MKAKQSFKGIPKEHRQRVREYMKATMTLNTRLAKTPQAAYKSLKAAWKHNAERKAKEEREQKKNASEQRERARHKVYPALVMLGNVRAMLSAIAGGESFAGLTEEDGAEVAEAALVSAATTLEMSLIRLGLIEVSQAVITPDEMLDTLTKQACEK